MQPIIPEPNMTFQAQPIQPSLQDSQKRQKMSETGMYASNDSLLDQRGRTYSGFTLF
jgi:hypothetical protein